MSKHTFGVYIGRFQPFHNAHLELILEALERVQKIIIIIGSAKNARTIKNPFTYEERVAVITQSLLDAGVSKNRFVIKGIQDYFYNEQKWLTEVQNIVSAISKGTEDVALLGHIKDDSSYYLRSFPHWKFLPSKIRTDINATDIRTLYFKACGDKVSHWELVKDLVPQAVQEFLSRYEIHARYHELCAEFEYIEKYKEEQKVYPWPIIFVTVDPVVIRSGHVLVVRRGGFPGKGLLALPGGFLDAKETILQSTLRELHEETAILYPQADLLDSVRETQVFDYQGRSLRGRTITHATLIDLKTGQLPRVAGGDDAAEAFWMPLNEAIGSPELFMDDHWAIIYHFSMRF